MSSFWKLLGIEARKAQRSRLPLWTALGALVMPLGVAFLIFVAHNPALSQKLGLISAKANLLAYVSITWSAYLTLCGEVIGAGGFILAVLVISWVFGREFSDGTLKDLLAAPVPRLTILLAKFALAAVWSFLLSCLMGLVGLALGFALRLPGGSASLILSACRSLLLTGLLVAAVLLPFGFIASIGRGYLLPLGMALLVMILGNIIQVAGWASLFPWAIPALYAQDKSLLTPASYLLVILTALLGVLITWAWWQTADQNK